MNLGYSPWAKAAALVLCWFASVEVVYALGVEESAPAQDEIYEGDIIFGEDFLGEEDVKNSSFLSESKQLWGGDRKYIFQHDLAYKFTNPEGIGSNRSSMRFQWSKVSWEKLYIKVDLKPVVYLNGDDSLPVNQKSDSSLKIKELFGSLNLGNTSITFGDKIIVWGEAESSPVTDIISPQNIQDLVFTSLDESRISQTMVLIEHYIGKNQFSFIVNPDIEVDDQPVVVQNNFTSKVDGKDMEVGVRWKAPIGRGDFSLMVADVVDNSSVPLYIERDVEPIALFYKGYTMIGATANLNFGKTALQLESAYNRDRAQSLDGTIFNATDYPAGYDKGDEFLLAINMKFQENGLRDWSAGVLHTVYLDHSDDYSNKDSQINEIFLGVSNKFYHELIQISAQYQYEIESDATIGQLMMSYRATDNLIVSIDIFNLDNIAGGFSQGSAIARFIYSF